MVAQAYILQSYKLTSIQDVAYLSPIIKAIESEKKERLDMDAMVVKKS